jgi:uridylate kinase
MKFNRVLIKLSGESLMGNKQFGIDPEDLANYAREIKKVHQLGVQVGIVIGGGNKNLYCNETETEKNNWKKSSAVIPSGR